MDRLIQDNETIMIMLDGTDTLNDMATVSGYTRDKLKGMIEEIINKSIWEEVNRDAEI